MQVTTCGGATGAMECDTELPEERVGGRSSTIVLFFCAPTATIAAACHTKPPHLPDGGRGLCSRTTRIPTPSSSSTISA